MVLLAEVGMISTGFAATASTAVGIEIPTLGSRLLSLDLLLLLHCLELIEQSLVADLQDLGGLTTVPSRLGQDALDGDALGLHGGATSDLQERRHLHFRRRAVAVSIAVGRRERRR